MLGGDEDNLDDLIEACRNQVEGPEVRANPQSSGSAQPGGPDDGEGYQAVPSQSRALDPTVQALLDQNNRLMQELVKQRQAEPTKRKEKSEVSYAPQEAVMLYYESYRIEDDAETKIDTHLRQNLRPINSDPMEYWTKGAFKQVDRPIRGSAMYLEHIMPGHVNESTTCKNYDRCAHLEIKNWLTKNAGVGRANFKRLKIHEVVEDAFSMGIETQWGQATQVYEVVDAGFNFLCVEFMTRNYSYTAIAMLRCLHEVRYFCGVADTPKLQRTLIESFFNEAFKVSLINIDIDLKDNFSTENFKHYYPDDRGTESL